MKTSSFTALLAGSVFLLAAEAAQAQLSDLFKMLAPTSAGVIRQADTAASGPGAAGPAALAAPGQAPAMRGKKSAAEIAAELAPDRQCQKVQEKFDISEKLMDYGGTEASLRLQALVDSDFKYSDLSDDDRRMLRYLAQTTVWVPASVEQRLGSLADELSGRPPELKDLQRLALDELQQQSQKFRQLTQDFPGEVGIRVNPELADGAFAKFGGRIQISTSMLNLMSENTLGAEFVLAHEMAHIYKRHALKHLQFSLLSSKDGWELGKKLLARAQRGASFDPLRDGMFAAFTIPQLLSYVRGMQLHFNGEQELEADACAAQWLRLAAVDPSSAWDSFRSAFATGGYDAEHPATEERAKNFARRLVFEPTAAGPKSAEGDKGKTGKAGRTGKAVAASPADAKAQSEGKKAGR
ncbi:M48 family metalloprotease [Roseateles sp. PN1]|uniref:M48 family metalloprotease n=1 Tax=Roseateles sp. PN1 TaxID=3137372 RepID=UPI003138F3A8